MKFLEVNIEKQRLGNLPKLNKEWFVLKFNELTISESTGIEDHREAQQLGTAHFKA